jgi:cell division transport system permease protein
MAYPLENKIIGSDNSSNSEESIIAKLSLPTERETSSFNFHFNAAIQSIRIAPFTFASTVFTGVITYTILILSLVLFSQVNKAIQSQGEGVSLRLYIKDSVSEAEGRIFHSDITSDPRILSSAFITRQEALVRFREMLGEDADILAGLGVESPLPASIEVRFKENINSAKVFKEYEKEYSDAPEIERIEYSKSFIGYLTQLQKFISKAGVILFLIFATITGLVVANAARLGLYAHREEIQIMKLLGAKDWFVRAPYLIEGGIQGALSGVLGLILAYGLYLLLLPVLIKSEILSVYLKKIQFLSLQEILLVLFMAIAIGVLSTLFGTRRVENS